MSSNYVVYDEHNHENEHLHCTNLRKTNDKPVFWCNDSFSTQNYSVYIRALDKLNIQYALYTHYNSELNIQYALYTHYKSEQANDKMADNL